VKLGLGEERDIFTYVDMSSAQITCNYMELISQEGLRFEFSGNDIFSPWIALYYTATEDMDMYIWSSDTRLQALSASVNDDIVIDTNYVESSGMYHLGQVKKGDSIVVHFYSAALSSEIAVKNIAFYAFDNDAFEEIRSEITDEVLTVDSIKSNEMEAGINAQNDGICYVALPYSPGYTVSVDGIEADTVVIGSGMLGIPLTAGTHKITIKYQTPGFVTGIIYSILGILIYIALILKGCLSKNSTAPKRKI
jgi:uncharacterized membrane protein YfhO